MWFCKHIYSGYGTKKKKHTCESLSKGYTSNTAALHTTSHNSRSSQNAWIGSGRLKRENGPVELSWCALCLVRWNLCFNMKRTDQVWQ